MAIEAQPAFAQSKPPAVSARSSEDEAYYVASQWQLIWWKLRRHRLAVIAGPVLVVLYLMAIFADFLSPTLANTRFESYKDAPPQQIQIRDAATGQFQAPFLFDLTRQVDPKTFLRTFTVDKSKKFPVHFFGRGESYKLFGIIRTDRHLIVSEGPLFLLGTDSLGHDLFSRILYGSRISLTVGLVGVALTFTFGLFLGGISGYLGGYADTAVQRLIDLVRCIPTIPLWMTLAAALPRSWSTLQTYVAIVAITSIIGWTGLARVVRGKLLSLREEEYVMSARLAGANPLRIILRHLLPSFLSYIIVSLTLSIPNTIIGETSLSFLGLGLQPPAVSWGVLLKDAQNLQTLAYHSWLLWPAAWVIVTVLMFNFLGDGLRDAADPYK